MSSSESSAASRSPFLTDSLSSPMVILRASFRRGIECISSFPAVRCFSSVVSMTVSCASTRASCTGRRCSFAPARRVKRVLSSASPFLKSLGVAVPLASSKARYLAASLFLRLPLFLAMSYSSGILSLRSCLVSPSPPISSGVLLVPSALERSGRV